MSKRKANEDDIQQFSADKEKPKKKAKHHKSTSSHKPKVERTRLDFLDTDSAQRIRVEQEQKIKAQRIELEKANTPKKHSKRDKKDRVQEPSSPVHSPPVIAHRTAPPPIPKEIEILSSPLLFDSPRADVFVPESQNNLVDSDDSIESIPQSPPAVVPVADQDPVYSDALWVKVLIGGMTIQTTAETLTSVPNTIFTSILSKHYAADPHELNSRKCYSRNCEITLNIDRDISYFNVVLNYLRTGAVYMDKSMNIHGLLEEAKYYGIDKMVEDLELMIQEKAKKKQEKKAMLAQMISVKPQYVQQQQVQHAAITKLTREDVYDMLLRAHSSDAIRLRGVDLSNIDLSKFDLSKVNLSYCNLKNTNMNHALIKQATLSNAILHETKMEHSEGEELVLDGTTVRKVLLESADWSGSKIQNCMFEDCNMVSWRVTGSIIGEIQLQGCKMKDSNFTDCKITKGQVYACDLMNASMMNAIITNMMFKDSTLNRVKFTSSTLTNVSFEGQDLSLCDFNKCTLEKVNMNGCQFGKHKFKNVTMISCTFREAMLKESKWSECKLKDCDFTRAKLYKCKIKDSRVHATYSENDMRYMQAEDVDFMNSKFENSDLSEAKFERVQLHLAKLYKSNFTNAKLAMVDTTNAHIVQCTQLHIIPTTNDNVSAYD